MFSRIAIVNRGEAAMRLIHAVRDLNAQAGPDGGRIATVAVGYADGFLRAGSSRGAATLRGRGEALPIVGRISMDCLAVDVTGIDPASLPEGAALELIGPNRPLEDVAEAAGTIGYEILTALGHRYGRTYEG